METKYALLNPANGEYDFFETEEIVKQELAKRALSFYITHAHGIAYSKITIDENGWETWDSKNNVNILDEEAVKTFIAEKI
jgi:hypothetical protein